MTERPVALPPDKEERAVDDLKAKLEKLQLEAEDCELIARLATDLKKRAFFAKMSVQLRAMARDIEAAIKARSGSDAT